MLWPYSLVDGLQDVCSDEKNLRILRQSGIKGSTCRVTEKQWTMRLYFGLKKILLKYRIHLSMTCASTNLFADSECADWYPFHGAPDLIIY